MPLGPARSFLVCLSLLLSSCRCVTFDGAVFRCDETGGCPAGQRCAQPTEPEAGFCIPLNDGVDGGLPPGVRAVDLVFANQNNGALDGFVVLVALEGATTEAALVANPSTDLRFYDPDTQQNLPFQIDTWNPAGESLLWVLVPNIAANSATDRITLYFGEGAGGQEDPTGHTVFGDYSAVWHLGPGAVSNSANAQFTGTRIGGTTDQGRVGNALRWSGTGDQRVTFDNGAALFDSWGPFSLELWIRPDYASLSALNAEAGVLDKGGGLNLGRVFRANPDAVFQVDMHFRVPPNDSYLGTAVALQQWTWLVYDFDGLNLVLYVNGVEDGRDIYSATTTLRSGTNPFFLGDRSTPLQGAIDEVRIAQRSHDASWMRAQYLSMTRAFVAFQPR